MNDEALQTAVQNGAQTRTEIADAVDRNATYMSRVLRQAVDEGVLAREKDGRAYTYHLPAGHEPATDDDGAQAPLTEAEFQHALEAPAMEQDLPDTVPDVERDYSWDEYVPALSEVAEYIPTDGEWERVNAKVDARHQTGQEMAFLFGGPTGSGKTTAAEYMSAERGWPLFTVQMTYDMSPAALEGKATVRSSGDGGTETVWNDGVLSKALLASRERTVILLIDEANRARPEVHSTLMSALDSRCEVTLDQRGGEKIRGIRENLIVFSTINPKGAGDYHGVQDIDFAVKRRLSNAGRYDVDYLGMEHPEREAELVADRTPVCKRLGELIVEAANQVRERADDPTSDVRSGIPTSTLISWAQSAHALNTAGLDNAVIAAAEDDVVDALYDQQQTEQDTVSQILKDNLDGCPVDEASVLEWAGDTEMLACTDCSYESSVTDAGSDVTDFMECPDCGSHVAYE